ncbi:BatD family protein [Alteromonas macleodii]|uniref:Oxygen tolerance family protein n=1 Tax=Alteromonas macleodii TaxID=28108 RepID=A0AB36FWK0_ALTMA|nr:BatD family protein [Alteromonas macleodii]OES34427.1 oxygen tolerance family protein [Alteromonas macleodii]OES35506.1 oxygen tolerance family protein [Alteromonas macleodii]OES36793.1 oxygen tolerance family protein [Alteromonas macleodii]OES42262.1 oxygen tolerance family protein [Alteromonas macleodii]OZC00682.1 aerotolerance regulator BatD [Alteromonas macleodii]
MRALLQSTRIVFLLTLLLSTAAYADVNSLEATIDRNPVMLDEAIRLTVTADGSADRDAFDSSPLLKDFVVGRTSVSSQTSIVNFDTKRTTVWTTTLFPRKEGTFTIPSLTIEGKSTQPIQVKVIPVQEKSNVARDYFVTTDIDVKEAYLNQQLLYTVKLFLSSNIERGSLQAPEMQNAEITQLGEDKQYTDIVNGRRYQIIERQFAVVPQASGEFTLRGPIFTGEVMAANTNQRFGFFNRTQQINRVGPDITVNIKPIPQGIDYPWLPSAMVRVDEEWPQGDSFVAGEPVTRIVTLTALGVVEEQLPDIPEFYPPNFKLYPDQSNTTTVEKDQSLISQRQTSLAIIPTQPGNFVLPEITIPWFNTLTQQTEYSTIPARSITVAPASGANNANTPNSLDTPSISSASNEDIQNDIPTTAKQPNASASNEDKPLDSASGDVSTDESTQLNWMVTCALLVLFIIALTGWLVTYRKLKQAQFMGPGLTNKTGSAQRPHSYAQWDEKAQFQNLMSVIKAKDTRLLTPALKQWINALTSGKAQLSQFEGINASVNELYALRFSANKADANTQSKQVMKALDKLSHEAKLARSEWKQKSEGNNNTLSALYPAS